MLIIGKKWSVLPDGPLFYLKSVWCGGSFVEKNYGLTKCWNRWQGISCRGGICVEENCVFEGEARPMQELCLWESMV